jgi:hypothetical protein
MEDTGIRIYWELKRNISNREKWRETLIIIEPIFRLVFKKKSITFERG